MTLSKNRLLTATCAIWAIVCPAFLIACNFISPKAKTCCDYMVSFYTSGLLLLHGRAAEIYPPMDCTSWKDSPINAFAHSCLLGLAPELTANFMYSPLVAALMAPWAVLPPTLAVSAWQVFNLILLVLSSVIISRCARAGNAFDCFTKSMFYGPIIAAIWVGQTSIAFGVAPLALAAYLLCKQRPFAAGIALSILQLKPQLLIISIICALFAPKRKRTLQGLASGLAVLTVLTYMVMPQYFQNWLHSLQLSEQLLGGQGYSMASYLAASLPSSILLLLSADQRSAYHFAIYATCFVLASASSFFVQRKQLFAPTNPSEPSNDEESPELLPRINSVLFLALLVEVLCAPRLILYDASLMLVPLLLLYVQSAGSSKALLLVNGSIAATGLYVIACMTSNPSPLVLVSILISTSTLGLIQLKDPC